MKNCSTLLLLIFSCLTSLDAQNMNNERLDSLLNEVADTIQRQGNVWEFIVEDIAMICITDESNNRMRIMSPIKEVKELTDEELISSLEANFHTSLDVRYAIAEKLIWSAFIHPLRELSDQQVFDAVIQVYSATQTFGTIYTSTYLTFPKGEEAEQVDKF